MAEVPHPGQDHRHPVLVRRFDDLLVAHRASRMDRGRGAGLGHHVEPVPERKEGVRGTDGPLGLETGLARPHHSDPRRVNAAHLPRAHADQLVSRRQDDGVGLHVLGDPPREAERSPLPFSGLALRDNAEGLRVEVGEVGILDEEAAEDASIFLEAPRQRAPVAGDFEHPALPLRALQLLQGVGTIRGGEEDLQEDPRQLFHHVEVERAVDAHNAAVDRNGVGGFGLPGRLGGGRRARSAAGVRVLDDDSGRLVELEEKRQGRREIQEVVVGERGAASGLLRYAAIAASYWAVRRNASRASRERVSLESAPSDRFSSSRTSPYWAASTSTATDSQFFAAARIRVGPPMSICSTASARRVPGFATVCSKGYRLIATRSMGSIPWARSWARCSGLSRRARIPAWIFGWSVFTRPSSISGNPVTSATSRTFTPDSRRSLAVPPVERISTPRAASPRQNSTAPVLSWTLTRARRTVITPP